MIEKNLVKVGVPIVALVTPLLKLNGSIIRLNERLETVLNHNNTQDLRLNKHSEQIDDLTAKSENHNVRIMNLEQILNYRRSIRYYSDTKLVDTEKVAHCLRLAQLAPTSSNMQLYEMYHITDKDVLKKLASACLEQNSAGSAS